MPYHIWYDLFAFLDGVILYAKPEEFSKLFEQGKILRQYMLSAKDILCPIKLETKGMSLPSKHIFSGFYNRVTLPTYFECLDKALKNFDAPVSFTITIGGHAFAIDYFKGKWRYTDIEDLEMGEKECNNNEIAQLLLQNYSQPIIFSARVFTTPDLIEEFNQSIISLKKEQKWIELHEITQEQNTGTNLVGHTLLYVASKNGDEETVKRCIAAGAKCELERSGLSPFFVAVDNGHLEIVKEFIKSFNNENLINQSATGLTPLYIAVQEGHLEIVKVLLKIIKNENTMNQTTNEGAIPLHIAAQNGNLEIVQELIKALNDKNAINQPTRIGMTPLHLGVLEGHLEVVKELIKALKNKNAINQPMNDGRTPFLIAVQEGFTTMVDEFLKNGADLEKTTEIDTSVLLEAARELNCEEKLRQLFAQEEIGHILPGFTPLHAAILLGHENIIELLVKNGAKFITPTKEGISIYKLAVAMGRINLLAPDLQQLEPYENKFYKLLEQLQETRDLLIQKAKVNSHYSTVAVGITVLSDTLGKETKAFFANPSASTFQEYRKNCEAAINAAVNESAEYRGWHAVDPIIRGIIGILAALTVIPALVVAATSQHGYVQTFFAKPAAVTEEKINAFKIQFQEQQNEVDEEINKSLK